MLVARTTVPPESSSVGIVRAWAVAFCTANGGERHTEAVALLVSELVTNSIIHGRSDVTVEVSVAQPDEVEGDQVPEPVVRVAVADEDSRLPRFEQAGHDALGGRGLALVQALADACGVEERAFGKAVWFTLGAVPPVLMDLSADEDVRSQEPHVARGLLAEAVPDARAATL